MDEDAGGQFSASPEAATEAQGILHLRSSLGSKVRS